MPYQLKEVLDWMRSHRTSSDPHGHAAALATHVAATNPHPTYATDADLTAHAATSHGAHTLISHQILGASTASVTFSSIAQTYRHLRLQVHARSTLAATEDVLRLQVNGDTTAVYDYKYTRDTTVDAIDSVVGTAQTSMILGIVPAASAGSAAFAGGYAIDVFDYRGATLRPVFVSDGFAMTAASDAGLFKVAAGGVRRDNAAITSLTLFPGGGSFPAGSVLSLYGVS